jgi:short-subunit dehydrogenase
MKTVIITGAADGIGRALVFEFAKNGYAIIGLDFDPERSHQTESELTAQGFSARFIQTDLSQPDFLAELLPQVPSCDVLVNNAGISAVGAFAALDWARQQRVLDVNLRAPIQLTNAILKNGSLKPGGSLVFISSLSHYVGYPGAAVYAASKDGLAAYARNLRIALTGQNHVLVVFPGPTRTAHARRYSPDNTRESKRMSPEILAAQVLRATEGRKDKLFPGPAAWLMGMVGLWFPSLAERVMKRTLFDALDGKKLT